MDYFEATVARILEEQGYWVRQSVRFALSKETKKRLGKPSLPRCEVDIVAYQPSKRTLLLLEVKSYLDSHGVQPKGLLNTGWAKNRYKLLTIAALQQEISSALLTEYQRQGLSAGNLGGGPFFTPGVHGAEELADDLMGVR